MLCLINICDLYDYIYIYISSVCVHFPIGLDFPFITFIVHSSEVLMKSIGAEFLRADALVGVNHMRGMPYRIVINIAFCP